MNLNRLGKSVVTAHSERARAAGSESLRAIEVLSLSKVQTVCVPVLTPEGSVTVSTRSQGRVKEGAKALLFHADDLDWGRKARTLNPLGAEDISSSTEVPSEPRFNITGFPT